MYAFSRDWLYIPRHHEENKNDHSLLLTVKAQTLVSNGACFFLNLMKTSKMLLMYFYQFPFKSIFVNQ